VVNRLGIHGGQVYQVAKLLGRPVESLIDFSASVNPLGPPASVLNAMRAAVTECQHYPDTNSEDLRARLAHEHKISAESILVGNGSAEIIRSLPHALGLRHACIVGPTFSEFEQSLRLAGVRYTGVDAESDQLYAPPVEKLHQLLQGWQLASTRKKGKAGIRHHAVLVCNPNSPTGRRLALRDFRKIVGEVHRMGCWMIVDEAFMDWCPSHSLINDISRWPHLIILRSFTKFFAIPGIRLGYLVGEPAVVESIRKHLPPWSVNHVAQAAGVAALADARFRFRSQRFMERERHRFFGELRMIPGLRVMPSQANFVMVEIADDLVTEDIVFRLQDQGILVRDCQAFSGVTQPALRFAVRRRRDNHRLVQALKMTLKDVQR
jgi:threonine-phosphate decarboxylase